MDGKDIYIHLAHVHERVYGRSVQPVGLIDFPVSGLAGPVPFCRFIISVIQTLRLKIGPRRRLQKYGKGKVYTQSSIVDPQRRIFSEASEG